MSCSEVAVIDLSGKLIALEGLDFTGKSSLAPRIAERLRAAGYTVVTSREPGGTPIGERVRSILLSREEAGLLPLSELLLFLLFMVSRAQHAREVILPSLRAGKTVITSRYRLSSLAYQGYGRGLDLGLIRTLNDAATEGKKADLTFLIDLPVDVALARRSAPADRIEQEGTEFYERVRRGYLKLASEDPSVEVIDGTAPLAKVSEEIARRLSV